MALINCPECNKEISDAVDNCPFCGYPIKGKKKETSKQHRKVVIVMATVVIIVVAVIGLLLSNRLNQEEQADVNMVTAAISSLGDIELNSEKQIASVEALYEGLSLKCKRHIKNYSVLTDARSTCDSLKASQTIQLIDAIGTVSLNSESAIKRAETSYTQLTEKQKSLVTNDSVLDNAKEELSELKAANVENMISGIGSVSLESADVIKSVRNSYDSLTDEEKLRVSNKADLDGAEQEYSELAVTTCIAMIGAIDDITLESKDSIEAAKTLYNSLSSDMKSQVYNYNVLSTADSEYKRLAKEEEERKKTLSPGDKFSTQKWEITYKRTNIGAAIVPDDTSGYYTYYTPNDDSNTFIDMVFRIKNIDVDILSIDNLVKDCNVEYDGTVLSKACALFTSGGHSIDRVYMWDGLGALESITLHVAIAMPREIQKNDAQITVRFNMAGQDKIVHVR